ncbi:MAG: folylpolyglutamate synthase/dihydrofolate synthase family protein [Pyrinomonadaceae bacterium]
MNFHESESYLLSLGNEVETMKLGLDNIRTLLDALGNPQNNYLKVQVAGTNGKGSVCAFLDSICFEAGIPTGLYTSPHLVSITERIKIGGKDVSEKEFARLATIVRETSESLVANGKLERVPTYFEQVTAMALQAFADAKVELAILETGLGGRFDATTAANAEIAAITRIDLDHQEYLGETIEEIAAEKAAIITQQTQYVILGEQSHDVMHILWKRCSDLGIDPLNDEHAPWRILKTDNAKVDVHLHLIIFPPIHLGLLGTHQFENAQTAIQIVRALGLIELFPYDEEGESFVIKGLENARHPGRLEYAGRFLFDGAHNIAGARALREYLDEFVTQPITMIFAAMKDKEIAEIGEILFPKAETLILTRPENSRAIDPAEILAQMPDGIDLNKVVVTQTVKDAIAQASNLARDNGLILVTGSLYLIGEVKRILSSQI